MFAKATKAFTSSTSPGTASNTVSHARASRIASSCPKDFDFQYFAYSNEGEYKMWLNTKKMLAIILDLPEQLTWNMLVALFCLVQLIMCSMNFNTQTWIFYQILSLDAVLNIGYDLIYLLNTCILITVDIQKARRDKIRCKVWPIVWYIVDFLTFSHYYAHKVTLYKDGPHFFKVTIFSIRMHRPLRFLINLNDYHLKGSVIATCFKYIYILIVVLAFTADCAIWSGIVLFREYKDRPYWLDDDKGNKFYRSYYYLQKMIVRIGPDIVPENFTERMFVMLSGLAGCLILSGFMIASLALVVTIYMKPEETFRQRFSLIMQQLKMTSVPQVLRQKVATFYRMYWMKQKAVSYASLLHNFPPSLTNSIKVDIYFEGFQKSLLLQDLSYQFLTEISKCMHTVNYIPGDTIVKRKSLKSHIIYIAYGDVEVLTAEDDQTPMLRFTRGSILNPCGGVLPVACTRAHVAVRAATFCTAHVLKVSDLWRVCAKYGKIQGQTFILFCSFQEYFEKVLAHYRTRSHPDVKYKSSLSMLKRNLIDLKKVRDENGELLLGKTSTFLQISGCYTMRNQQSVSLHDDIDDICLRPYFPCILQPQSSLQIAWEYFVACFTLLVAFTHPYFLVYRKTIPIEFYLFDYTVTFIYILDIITHLSTGAKIEEGIPITFTHTASQQLNSGWFVFDVLSVLPIFDFVGTRRFAGINKLAKLPKLFRTLKRTEERFEKRTVLRFCSYYLFFIFIVYYLAATQQGYSCFICDYCLVTNYSQLPFWAPKPLDDGPTVGRLLYSLYWAVSVMEFTTHKTALDTLMHWGDQFVMMLLLLFCTVMDMLVQSTYSATIAVSDIMRNDYTALIGTVKTFLVKNNIDIVLQHRFIQYLKLCWHTDKGYSLTHKKTTILHDLPKHVKMEILTLERNKFLMAVPFIKHIPKTLLQTVCSEARFFVTSPNEILQNTGDLTNEIYVIKKGFCEVVHPETKKVVSIITSKDYFGHLEVLLRVPSFYTVRAVTHVEVFSFSRRYFLKAFKTPKIKDALTYLKEQPVYKSLLSRKTPFLNYEIPPKPPNREMFPLPRKHEPDIVFIGPFSRLGFFSILRYAFPRFTLRPDGSYLRRYEWFRAFCALLSANIFPLYTTLMLQWPWLTHLGRILDVTAYYDIIQRMLVGYFDSNGILVYHPASTAAHYMKGAFIVDFLACLPLECFDNMRNDIYYEENSHLQAPEYQYLMYNRLIQIYRLPNALEILNDYIDRQDITLIIRGFPIFSAVLVVMTSLLLESSFDKWRVINGGWRITSEYSQEQGSWVEINKKYVGFNITRTPWNAVVAMFYWTVYETTSTGFNLFQPTSIEQMYYLCTGMMIALMIITYLGVQVMSIRSNVNRSTAEYHIHMKDMLSYMKKEKLESFLQKEVVSYFEYSWKKLGGTGYSEILRLVDQITLRTDAILHIYGQTFYKCPALYRCDTSLLRLLGRTVNSMYVREDITIIEPRDVIRELYVIDSGIVAVKDEFHRIITKLPRGSMFGNLDNTDSVVCPTKFVASKNLHLLKIDTHVFYEIIKEFPTIWVNLKKCRPRKENYIIGTLNKPSQVSATWMERAASTTIIVVSKKGLLQYFYAHSKNVQIYFIIVSMISIYGDIYNFAFENNSTWLIAMLYFSDFLFLFKLALFAILPYTTDQESETRDALIAKRKNYAGDPHGTTVRAPATQLFVWELASAYKLLCSLAEYYKVEFKFDVLSLIPIELFSLLYKRDKLEWFSILRLNRFLRTVSLSYSLKRYIRNLTTNLTIATVVTVSTWFSLFLHTTACIWYTLAHLEEKNKPQSSWLYFNTDEETSCSRQKPYFCSVYFVLTTFSLNGVGDILPRRQSEVMFSSILMLVSMMMLMIYVGEFSNIIQYQSFRLFEYYSNYLELLEFLKNNRVSQNLQNIAKKYSLHLWRDSSGRQVPHFLMIAPRCLRLNIMSAAYIHRLKSHPIFKQCEPEFLRHVVGCFKVYMYLENMFVVKEGEITNSMYFIHKGTVEEYDETIDEKIVEFTTGEHFGTIQGLQANTPYTISYRTVNKAQILKLCLNDWKYLLRHFPESEKAIFKDEEYQQSYDDKEQIRIRKTAKVTASEMKSKGKESRAMKLISMIRKKPSSTAPAATAPKPTSEVKPFTSTPDEVNLRKAIKEATKKQKSKQPAVKLEQLASELITLTTYDDKQDELSSFPTDNRHSQSAPYSDTHISKIKTGKTALEAETSSLPLVSSKHRESREDIKLKDFSIVGNKVDDEVKSSPEKTEEFPFPLDNKKSASTFIQKKKSVGQYSQPDYAKISPVSLLKEKNASADDLVQIVPVRPISEISTKISVKDEISSSDESIEVPKVSYDRRKSMMPTKIVKSGTSDVTLIASSVTADKRTPLRHDSATHEIKVASDDKISVASKVIPISLKSDESIEVPKISYDRRKSMMPTKLVMSGISAGLIPSAISSIYKEIMTRDSEESYRDTAIEVEEDNISVTSRAISIRSETGSVHLSDSDSPVVSEEKVGKNMIQRKTFVEKASTQMMDRRKSRGVEVDAEVIRKKLQESENAKRGRSVVIQARSSSSSSEEDDYYSYYRSKYK